MFVDASFRVAISDERDRWHGRAKRVAGQVARGAKVLDLAASEAFTIVGARSGGKVAQQLYRVFQDSSVLIELDGDHLDRAMDRHLTLDGRLSVTDGATIEAMVRAADRTIVSFDSDFDRVKGLQRIH